MSVSPNGNTTQEVGSVAGANEGCDSGHVARNDSVYWGTQSADDGSAEFSHGKRSSQVGRIRYEVAT
jgi:hypothetical protein